MGVEPYLLHLLAVVGTHSLSEVAPVAHLCGGSRDRHPSFRELMVQQRAKQDTRMLLTCQATAKFACRAPHRLNVL